MNSAEHKVKAEELLRIVGEVDALIRDADPLIAAKYADQIKAGALVTLAKAQVHATLALYPDPPVELEP